MGVRKPPCPPVEANKEMFRKQLEARFAVEGTHWIPLLVDGKMNFRGKTYSIRKLAMWIYNGVEMEKDLNYTSTCDNPDCCNPDHLEPYRGSVKPGRKSRTNDGVERDTRDWKSYDDYEVAAGSRSDLCEHPDPRRLREPGSWPMLACCDACGSTLLKSGPGEAWSVMKSDKVRYDPQRERFLIL